MPTVWMSLGDQPAEEVPFDAEEVAKKHRAGWRQCDPPAAPAPPQNDQPTDSPESHPEGQ